MEQNSKKGGINKVTDFYVRLNYDEYKNLEDQLKGFNQLETTHKSVEGFYHKAYRLKVGLVMFEFMGPSVPKPSQD